MSRDTRHPRSWEKQEYTACEERKCWGWQARQPGWHRGQNGDTIRAGSGEMGRGQIIKNFPYLTGAFGLHPERLWQGNKVIETGKQRDEWIKQWFPHWGPQSPRTLVKLSEVCVVKNIFIIIVRHCLLFSLSFSHVPWSFLEATHWVMTSLIWCSCVILILFFFFTFISNEVNICNYIYIYASHINKALNKF